MKILLSIFTLFAISFFATNAQACSCSYGGYWVSEFVEDKVIFEGQASESTWRENINLSPYEYGSVETKFMTVKPLKGEVPSEMFILHRENEASCGINYGLGRKHVVIASYGDDDALYASLCTSNAVPEITLLEYFETNTDVYIPSHWDCSDEQISNPNDPKNCYFLSDAAAAERREKMRMRWEKEWAKKRAARKTSRKDAQQK